MWRAIYDSVRGTSHLGSNLPCQDSCRVAIWARDELQTLCIACSDGAGSASHADTGSLLACNTLLSFVHAKLSADRTVADFDDCLILDAFQAAEQRIVAEATELSLLKRELACTLLFALVDDNGAVFAQIGDGAIVAKIEQSFLPIFWPQSGEYANTTNFLTSDRFVDLIQISRLDTPPQDLAVFTDGLERIALKFADKSVHAPFLQPLFDHLRNTGDVAGLFPQLRSFLESKAINDRTDDDKTLILASRLNVS